MTNDGERQRFLLQLDVHHADECSWQALPDQPQINTDPIAKPDS